MANQCPICSKQFVSKIALRNHTGTKDATLCRAHMCRKCEQKFCSEEAMVQHHDAPSHRVMFSCDVCKKPFASKQAMKQHKNSPVHMRMLARENFATGHVNPVHKRRPAIRSRKARPAAPATGTSTLMTKTLKQKTIFGQSGARIRTGRFAIQIVDGADIALMGSTTES
ncbi:hypothetical protein GGP41_004480 [Bipolaris sorokiniana]|uniref:C2H2-type domain-containing protein n=1 Tax=Cochliobolus sativus TaxID=45130 RepID=A0A8H5Z6D9_COCSA|nr:hypothetical protein GGP41_004480 [Bipolaris sorokiniana]